MTNRLLAAAGLGAVTGLRSFTGLAVASHELADRPAGEADGLRRWLADDTVSYVLAGLAIGEIVGDKLGVFPDRVEPAYLPGKALYGAAVGAMAAGRRWWPVGAAIGAAAALGAAWVGFSVRKEAGWATGLPDPIIAVAEDAIAVAGARGAARQL